MPNPMYSKPARPVTKTKTQLRKELTELRRDIKKGLNGPDADIYRVLAKALEGVTL